MKALSTAGTSVDIYEATRRIKPKDRIFGTKVIKRESIERSEEGIWL
jgi:hypothetical protein